MKTANHSNRVGARSAILIQRLKGHGAHSKQLQSSTANFGLMRIKRFQTILSRAHTSKSNPAIY